MAVAFVFLLSSFFAQSSGTHWKLQKVKNGHRATSVTVGRACHSTAQHGTEQLAVGLA